jgi:hypothetical protein
VTTYLIIVPNSPVEGGAGDYEEWYIQKHLPEFVAEGLVSRGRVCRQLRGTNAKRGYPVPEFSQDYVTVYEFETDDVEATFAALKERRKTLGDPKPGSNGYMDPSSVQCGVFEVLAEQG